VVVVGDGEEPDVVRSRRVVDLVPPRVVHSGER
jgi:hypothetical protein